MVLSAFVLLAPFCFLAGLLFPALCKRPEGEVYSASRGYDVESAGFLLGGMVASFMLIPLLSNLQGALAVIAVCSLVAAGSGRGLPLRTAGISLAGGTLFLACLPAAQGFDRLTRGPRFPGENLVRTEDTAFGTVTVTERRGLYTFREMGGWIGDTGSAPGAEEFVHLVLLSHPDPKNAALLGGGIFGEVGEVLKHPVEVDVALPDREGTEAMVGYLLPKDRDALSDSRTQLHDMDGRAFLKRATREGKTFDVLLVPVGDPLTGFLNRYYTVEFFREAAGALNPGGLLGINLALSPGYQSPPRRRLFTSVYRSLEAVFPNLHVLETDHAGVLLLASKDSLALEATLLEKRYTDRKLKTDFLHPKGFYTLLSRHDSEGFSRRFGGVEARSNRDLRPASYLLAFSLWRSRFASQGVLELAVVILPPLCLCIAVFWVAGRRRSGGRRGLGLLLSAGAVGLSGMAFEVGLLIAFQAAAGFIYTYLGALTASFMAGAAGGAWLWRDAKRPHRVGLCMGIAFGVFGLLGFVGLPWLAGGGVLLVTVLLFMILEALSGFLTGAFFPQVLSIFKGPDEAEGAGLLYGADLAGAAGGALLAGAVVIPLLGIPLLLFGAGVVAFLGSLLLLGSAKHDTKAPRHEE
jgi:spermidine synthase